MSDLQKILDLWRSAKQRQEEVCLVTVVRVRGSSYRKPGARMLLTRSGQHVGTVSGGCLEAEVTKRAWWLTERGAALQEFSSFFEEDSEIPYGMGCGGAVTLLLERGPAADAVLGVLDAVVSRRVSAVVLTAVGGEAAGTLLCSVDDGSNSYTAESDPRLQRLVNKVLLQRRSTYEEVDSFAGQAEVFAEYISPPPALFIFGAGDDAQPLANFAHALGWHITIADGRSHLANAMRFPFADNIAVLDYTKPEALAGLETDSSDFAVVLTHSYEQDRRLLSELLVRELTYVGILGPIARTQRLISEISAATGLTPEECWRKLHSPVGLDLGADTPVAIALSIVAEIQAVLHNRSVSVQRTASPESVHA